jgi:hypothetical protein
MLAYCSCCVTMQWLLTCMLEFDAVGPLLDMSLHGVLVCSIRMQGRLVYGILCAVLGCADAGGWCTEKGEKGE